MSCRREEARRGRARCCPRQAQREVQFRGRLAVLPSMTSTRREAGTSGCSAPLRCPSSWSAPRPTSAPFTIFGWALLAYTDASGRDDACGTRGSRGGIPDSVGDAQKVPDSGGVEPVWGPGGAELVFRAHDEMISVSFDRDTGRIGPAVRLFERGFERDPGGNLPDYAIAADGRFVMLQTTLRPRELRVVRNWGTEVLRAAPPR